ncbi:MAG: hypothetical protein ACK4VN_08925 [Bacteroidales bacterium]
MKTDKNKNDGVLEIFRKEFQKLEHYQSLVKENETNHEELQKAIRNLIADYEILLRDAIKITRIGDVSQHKLLKAKEKIEILNEKLVESERNVRELNTILMFYIKATDK